MTKARKDWAQAKRIYERESSCKDELKQTRKTYYHIIRKAKRECWQNFLQSQDTSPKIPLDNQNRYWTALIYTKSQQFKTTPILKDNEDDITLFIKEKEKLVYKIAFLSLPKSD